MSSRAPGLGGNGPGWGGNRIADQVVPPKMCYFVSYWYQTTSGWIPYETLLIEEHPLDWIARVRERAVERAQEPGSGYEGAYRLASWQLIPEEVYKKHYGRIE